MKTRRSLSNDKNAGNEKIDEKKEELGVLSTVKSLPVIRTLRSRTITSDNEDEVVRTPKSKKKNNRGKDESSSDVKDAAKDFYEVLSPKSTKKRRSASKLFVISEIKEEIEPNETETKFENEKTHVKLENSSDAVSVIEWENKIKVIDDGKERTEIKKEVEELNVCESTKKEDCNEENIKHVSTESKIEKLALSTNKSPSVSPKKVKGYQVDNISSGAVFGKEMKIQDFESINDSPISERKTSCKGKRRSTITAELIKDSSCEAPSSDSSLKKSSDSEEETTNVVRKKTPSKSTNDSPRKTTLTKELIKDSSCEAPASDSSLKKSSDSEEETTIVVRKKTPSKSTNDSPRKTTLTKELIKDSSCEAPSSDSSFKKSSDSEEETTIVVRKKTPSKSTNDSPRKTTLTKELIKDSSCEAPASDSSLKKSSDSEEETTIVVRKKTPSKSTNDSPRKTTLTKELIKDSSCEAPSSDSSLKKSSDSEEETTIVVRKKTPSKSTNDSPKKTTLTEKRVENLDDDQSSNDGSSKNSVSNEVNKDESEDDEGDVDSDDEMPEAISFESSKNQINQALAMAAEAIRKQKQKKKEEMKKRIEMIRAQKAEKERKCKEKLKQLEANLPPRLNEDVVSRLRDTPEIPTIREAEPKMKKRKKESAEIVPKEEEVLPAKKNKIKKFDDYIPLNNVEGSTKFGVVPLEVATRIPKSSSESAAEFKRQTLFGSRIRREPAKNQLIYQKKLTASGKHRYNNWGQFA